MANHPKKPHSWEEILARLKARAKNYKGKKEEIGHDLIAHGVSFGHGSTGKPARRKR
jgi:hypothetical protein